MLQSQSLLQAQAVDAVEVGRRLGHDLFRYRKPVVPRRLPSSVEEGYSHALAVGAARRVPDRFERKWLQLRLGAFERGRAFDDAVTPNFLQAMDVAVCPVLRVSLTHGEQLDTDWSVDRLNNDGAYARSNLAVMSARANVAKGARSFEDVLARSRAPDATDGLQPVEWLRLAVLMLGPCFATRPASMPCLPLIAPLSKGSVRLAMQQIQHLFTVRAKAQSGKNALIKQFKAVSADPVAERRLRELAEAVHVGLKVVDVEHDVWLQDGVMPALQRWRDALDLPAWARAGEAARCLSGLRQVPSDRLASWRLGRGGYMR